MKLAPDLHLTYCTNIHPGESWPEVRANLEQYVLDVRRRVAPSKQFGLGLRLSAQAAKELAEPEELSRFRDFLSQNGLYVFTINGFPYGTFHRARVKEDVYLPDWREDLRVLYTDRLAWLLAQLLPDDSSEPRLSGSISTVPGAFKARVASESDAAEIAERLLRHAVTLHRIREETGKTITLALEPEPCCYLETVSEAVAFFERYLFCSEAIAMFCKATGLRRGDGESFLHSHLGVCFDACHSAVEFEEPSAALSTLASAGIRIMKIQISAGLHVDAPDDPEVRRALARFAEGVYLHQVIEQRSGELVRYIDLPDALGAGPPGVMRRWRIHFHVPIFREKLGAFRSTQPELRRLLAELRRASPTQHLEIETYTWDVLPEELRSEGIVEAVAREITWTLEELGSRGAM